MCEETSLLDPITSLEEFALPISEKTSAQLYSEVVNTYYHSGPGTVELTYSQLGRLFFDHLQLQNALRKAKRTYL